MDLVHRVLVRPAAGVALALCAGHGLACDQIAPSPIPWGSTVTNLSPSGCNELAPLTNFGTILNEAGALLSNRSGASLVNAGYARLVNRGLLENQLGAGFYNEGAFQNLAGATIVNRGNLNISSEPSTSSFSNEGTLVNGGSVSGLGPAENTGLIYNLPEATGMGLGPLVNRATGTVVNASAATDPFWGGATTVLAIRNEGTVYNLGAMGWIGSNRGVVVNTGKVLAAGTSDNSGLILNTRQWVNGGTNVVSGLLGGDFVNGTDGVVINSGTYDNENFTRNAGAFVNLGTLTNRRTFSIAASGVVAGNGVYEQSQTLAVTRLDGLLAQQEVVIRGGRLLGTGTVVGSLTIARDAWLDPAGDAIGTFSLQGNLLMEGGWLRTEIASETQFDLLQMSQGTADLKGAVFEFGFVDDYRPRLGDSWEFLRAAGSDNIVGLDAVSLSFTGLPSSHGYGFELRRSDEGLLLAVVSLTAPVPEASSAALTLLGLLVVAGFCRRQRRAAHVECGTPTPAEARSMHAGR